MIKIISLYLITTVILYAQISINPKNLNVQTQHPKRSNSTPLGTYLGTYEYPLDAQYTISTNVDGFVQNINVKPYATLKKSQVILSIKSPKLLDLQSKYISTLLEKEYYEKEIIRLKPLVQKGAVASKHLFQSQNNFNKLKASATFESNVLLAYGMTKEQLIYINSQHKPDSSIKILAPISGRVADIKVENGSFVPQGATLMRLLNTDECHLEIAMNYKKADTLSVGDKLHSNKTVYTLFATAPQINTLSQTRKLDLHMEGGCNTKGGASLNIALYHQKSSWKVPNAAVVSLDSSHAIFVKDGNRFKMLEVTLLSSDDGFSFIDAKLNKNNQIATSSVLTLKSIAMDKDE